jgi:chemotaxis protein MotA
VLAIQSEMNPRLLETKLKSLLTPSMRDGKMVSIDKIKQRFKIYDEKKRD